MSIKHVGVILTEGLLVVFVLLLASSKKAYPFPYKGLDIRIEGTIGEMYDDNITYAKDNKIEDFITTVGLGLGATYEGKRRAFDFNALINHGFHARFKDIKSSSESLTLNFQNEFSKYDRVSLTDTFSHTQSPASFEEEFGRVRGRYNSYSNNIGLNYRREIGEQFILITNYVNSLNKISEADLETSYRSNSLGFEIDYTPSIANTFLVSYNFAKNNYDISTHTLTAGMKRYLTKRLYLDGRAGMDVTTFNNGNKDTRQHFNVSLRNEIDEKTTAELSFIRREQSTTEVGDVFSNWQITGSLTRQLSEKLNGSLSGFYGQGRFVSTGITDTLRGATSSLNYMFNEHLQGSLQYSFSNLDSTHETRGYIKNTMLLGLTAVF